MKVACIGGGTGTSVVLNGLKKYKDIELSVIVSMMDDGGSNAVVRDEFGLLPLSDLRKSVIALSSKNDEEILRKLFLYRFDRGKGLSGHTLGNLIMVALSDIVGSEKHAVEELENLFDVQGDIIPVTTTDVKLIAHYSDGTKVVGEHNIDEPKHDKCIQSIELSKKAKADPDAVKAILEAEYIVIGPGDIYTSILPNILVDGIADALSKTKGKLVYVTNLMSKMGETRNLSQSQIVFEIEKYVGRKMNYVFINSARYPLSLLEKYEKDGEYPIKDDFIEKSRERRKIVRTNLISRNRILKRKGDTLKRSYIRHDSTKLGRELYQLFRKSFFDVISTWIFDN